MSDRTPNVSRRSLALLVVVAGAMAVGYGLGMRSTGELGEQPHFAEWVERMASARARRADRDHPVVADSEAETETDAVKDQAAVDATGYDQMRRSDVATDRSWDTLIASASDLRRLADAGPSLSPTQDQPMDAIGYAGMRRGATGPTSQWEPQLTYLPTYDYHLCITCHNPHTVKVQPSQEKKLESLAIRSTRRAFNGAPPVVPHPVEHTNDAACYACHNQGVQIGDRVANRMSHGFLSNCVQCHAAPLPQALAAYDAPVDNEFVGLKTPLGGDRAFPDAPPVIPHSTWMRERCLSCHGGIAGWPGLEVTHRWRTNCTQCHAVSATLEQAVTADHEPIVPPSMVWSP